MTSEPNTFDAWWVSEHGHPPDSVQERRAFEDARIGWELGERVGRRFVDAKHICDSFSQSSQASFKSAFCQSVAFHLEGEPLDTQNLGELFLGCEKTSQEDVSEDVFDALTEARTCGKLVADILNESIDYKASQSPHRFAAATFGMISSFRRDISMRSVAGIIAAQARQLLSGTIYGDQRVAPVADW